METELEPFEFPTDLPELPDDWEYQSLAQLLDGDRGICYGIVQPGSHSDTGVPIVRVSNIKHGRVDPSDVLRVSEEIEEKYTRSRLRGGEVLLTLVGSLGESAVVPESLAGWNVARAIGVIPVRRDIAPRWVELCLRSSTSQHFIRTRATTTVQATLNLRDVAELPIPVPPKEEREAIASALGTLDDKIELNRRMNKTLEAMTQAIFKSWFVDAAQSALPEGWRWQKLGDLLSVIETGGRPRGGVSDITEGVPSVGAESIVGLGHFDYGKTKFVTRDFFQSMNKGHVHDGDVLLYKDGGRPGVFEPHVTIVGDGFPFSEFSINEHVYRLRTDPKVPQSFLYFWLCSDSAMDDMRNRGTGVAIPGLNSTQVRELAVLRPPTEVLTRFDRTVAPLLRRIFANCKESRTLASLRDALLPKLLSGAVRLKETS